MADKAGFERIKTLHARIQEPSPNMLGTVIKVHGIDELDLERAKALFLRFAGMKTLARTGAGDVLEPFGRSSEVFMNGLRIAEDDSLRFSYNITRLDQNMRKYLNRERNAVGRTACSNAIKSILRAAKGFDAVWDVFSTQLQGGFNERTDELHWIEIESIAAEHLGSREGFKPVFMTPEARNDLTASEVEMLDEQGRRVVYLSGKTMEKASAGLYTIETVRQEYNDSYVLDIRDIEKLDSSEKTVYRSVKQLKDFLRGCSMPPLPEVIISEKLRASAYDSTETKGCYDGRMKSVAIKRSILSDRADFFGTLLHEYAHYVSGADDNTREFENELTYLCGVLADRLIPDRRDLTARSSSRASEHASRDSADSKVGDSNAEGGKSKSAARTFLEALRKHVG